MNTNQVAITFYTLRDHAKTAPELARSARKVREIGYTAVQLSGLGPIPDDEIVRIMAGEGLVICATHEPSATILDEPERAIERVQRVGCKLSAYPSPKGLDFTSPASVADLVRRLDAAGAKFRAAGLQLGYHNHAFEFCKVNGTPILETIYAETNPKHLVAELDTYWIHHGGGDILDWCRRMRGRLPFIHLKDYCMTVEQNPVFGEIGQGTLPFAAIVAEAEASGCEWFIVEQDKCPGDPFESLARSFDYVKAHLCE